MKPVIKKVTCVVLIAVLTIAIGTGSKVYIQGHNRVDNADYQGKIISILGDSISTYAGYIPGDDGINLEHRAKYPHRNLVKNVNKTWWMQLINQLDAKLGVNDSWAGSTVSNTMLGNDGDWGEDAAMASLTRIQNLGSNGTPDVILFFGGTNDIGYDVPLGVFNEDHAPEEVDLTSTTWITFVDAYTAAIMRLQYYYPEAELVAVLPTYTESYYTEEELNYYVEEMMEICEYFDVQWVDLRDTGLTTDMMPDGIHPNAEGMDYITSAVQNALLAN